MNRNFPAALSLVLKSEGGFSDNPRDPGGATNKGITLATFRRVVNPGARVEQLKRISDADLTTIYRRQYWDRINGDSLPDGIDYAVFDFAVNSGPARAARYLQSVVGAVPDGTVGPATILACQNRNSSNVIRDLCAKRLEFLKLLSTWDEFGKGWTARVSRVEAEAIAMAEDGYAATVAAHPVPGLPLKPAFPDAPVVSDAAPTGFMARLKRLFA